MSPFAAADRIRKPLLLIHGEDDSNTGTFPIQASADDASSITAVSACCLNCFLAFVIDDCTPSHEFKVTSEISDLICQLNPTSCLMCFKRFSTAAFYAVV